MALDKINVTVFARIIGRASIKIPYSNQRKTPLQKIRNMPSEMSFADLDFQVFVNCGTNAMVVNVPAASPMIVIVSMIVLIGANV